MGPKQRLTIQNRAGRGSLTLAGHIGETPRRIKAPELAAYVRALQAYNATGSVLIYEEIDSIFGLDVKRFAENLDALGPIDQLDIFINSPGGSVFDGFALYSILARHPASKVVHVDGVAASIASVIAMVGRPIKMASVGRMMIHDPFAGVIGDAEDLRSMADLLDSLKGSIVDVYANRTRRPRAAIEAWMSAETWFNAEEAVRNRFADQIVGLDGNGDGESQAENVARRLRQLQADERRDRRGAHEVASSAAVAERLAQINRDAVQERLTEIGRHDSAFTRR